MKVPKYIKESITKTAKYHAEAFKYEEIVRKWLEKNDLLKYEDGFIDYCCYGNNVPELFIEELEEDIHDIDIGKIHYKYKRLNEKNLHEYTKAYKRVQNFYYKNRDIITANMKKEMFQKIRIIYDYSKVEPSYINQLKSINYKSLSKIYKPDSKGDD